MLIGEQISTTRHAKQREMSFQVKHLLATWSPGEAEIEHRWEVLTPLRLQAHFCLEGIHLCSSLLQT